jgi:hypothetical protein
MIEEIFDVVNERDEVVAEHAARLDLFRNCHNLTA